MTNPDEREALLRELDDLMKPMAEDESWLPSYIMDFAKRAHDWISAHGQQPGAGKPVAWLKEWEVDGDPRRRVDLDTRCERWLQLYKPRLTPLYAAPPPPPASAGVPVWNPIESAPHETLVLLYSAQRGQEVGYASRGEVWGTSVGLRSNRSWHGTATHWQPLPPPPGGEGK